MEIRYVSTTDFDWNWQQDTEIWVPYQNRWYDTATQVEMAVTYSTTNENIEEIVWERTG